MKSSQKGYLLAVILCINGFVFSQENKYEKLSFPMYADFVSKIYNVSCKMPENFIDLKYMEFLKIGKDVYRMGAYCPIMQSDDKECILMYHLIPEYGFLTSNIIKGEIGQMLDLNCCDNSIADTINIKHYATIISGYHARNTFNADSIIFMDIPLKSAYKDKYTSCTSMFIIKKAHATMIMKLFFTEAGKKDQHKYIKNLFKNIWYNDSDWTYDDEKSVISVKKFLDSYISNKKL